VSEKNTEQPITPSAAPTPHRFRLDPVWTWTCRVVGLVGVVHETFYNKGERPFLLIIFGTLLGFPTFVNLDVGTIIEKIAERWRSK